MPIVLKYTGITSLTALPHRLSSWNQSKIELSIEVLLLPVAYPTLMFYLSLN